MLPPSNETAVSLRGQKLTRSAFLALKSNKRMTRLDLSDMQLVAEDLELLSVLKNSNTLTALDLSNNRLAARKFLIVVANLPVCLSHLNVGDDVFSSELSSNSGLSELGMLGDDLSSGLVTALLKYATKLNLRCLTSLETGTELPTALTNILKQNIKMRRDFFSAVEQGHATVVAQTRRVAGVFCVDLCGLTASRLTVLHLALDNHRYDALEMLLSDPRSQALARTSVGLAPGRECALSEMLSMQTISPEPGSFTDLTLRLMYPLLEYEAKSSLSLDLREAIAKNGGIDAQLLVAPLPLPHGGIVLTSIDVRNCALHYLPFWMSTVTNLGISGNPLTFGVAANETKVRWNRMKVIVLGKEGSGKTNILKIMQHLPYEKDLSTDGIDVAEFPLSLISNDSTTTTTSTTDVMLTWFDFAGQSLYYPTHQFFLTKQCVYLLVFRMDDPEYEERVRYWTRNVSQFVSGTSKGARAVLVGTHTDKLTESDQAAIWHSLKPLMQNIVAYVGVSCETRQGFEALREGIVLAMQKVLTVEVPTYYLAVCQLLLDQRRTRTPKMQVTDFVRRAIPLRLSEEQVVSALSFLQDAGFCLCSRHLGLLISDPSWLIDMFKGLISFSHRLVKDGTITRSNLLQIWRDDVCISENMSLLERFGMAFAKSEGSVWVVPSMLPEFDGNSLPELNESFKRLFVLPFIPDGVIGRLIVQLSTRGVTFLALWRTAAVFERKKQCAHILLSNSGGDSVITSDIPGYFNPFAQLDVNNMSIAVHSESAELMQVCIEVVSATLSAVFSHSIVGAPFSQFVGCPHCDRWLSLEECFKLLASSSADRSFFTCGEDGVSLSLLLAHAVLGVSVVKNVRIEAQPFARGGFGDIYLGTFTNNNKKFVAKTLQLELSASLLEFQHEVSIMSECSMHRNIVQFIGIILSPLRMIMEFCAHGDLLSVIRSGQLPDGDTGSRVLPSLLLRILTDVAQGMEFLHSRSPPIIHRDLRSPNILIVSLVPGDEVVAKVGDFGLSVRYAERKLEEALLTYQWAAPEAYYGSGYDKSADVYSFAMICYEVFAKKIPFHEYHQKEKLLTLTTRIREEHLRPRDIPQFVPAWMLLLMQRMWNGDPTMRPGFSEIVKQLTTSGSAPASAAIDESDHFIVSCTHIDRAVDIANVRCVCYSNTSYIVFGCSSSIVIVSVVNLKVCATLTSADPSLLCIDCSGRLLSGDTRELQLWPSLGSLLRCSTAVVSTTTTTVPSIKIPLPSDDSKRNSDSGSKKKSLRDLFRKQSSSPSLLETNDAADTGPPIPLRSPRGGEQKLSASHPRSPRGGQKASSPPPTITIPVATNKTRSTSVNSSSPPVSPRRQSLAHELVPLKTIMFPERITCVTVSGRNVFIGCGNGQILVIDSLCESIAPRPVCRVTSGSPILCMVALSVNHFCLSAGCDLFMFEWSNNTHLLENIGTNVLGTEWVMHMCTTGYDELWLCGAGNNLVCYSLSLRHTVQYIPLRSDCKIQCMAYILFRDVPTIWAGTDIGCVLVYHVQKKTLLRRLEVTPANSIVSHVFSVGIDCIWLVLCARATDTSSVMVWDFAS